MNKKIAWVTNHESQCGIHGYSLSALENLKHSTRYTYDLHKAKFTFLQDDEPKYLFIENLCRDYDAVIYNWCPITMQWLTDEILSAATVPQYVIGGHDRWPAFENTRHNFVVQPHVNNTDWCTALPRPLVFYDDIQYTPPGAKIKIGSFGFGTGSKDFPRVVQIVNEQFANEEVELNIKMTYGKYRGFDARETHRIAQECRSLAQPNVKLNLEFGYIKNPHDLSVFLNSNDINLFLYKPQLGREAVSSCLDHALAARKPVGLTMSGMFEHAFHVPDIFIENRSIKEIIAAGLEPVQPLISAWTASAYCNAIERYLEQDI